MTRLRDTYHYQGIHFSHLYEMFHDYLAYINKGTHLEFSFEDVANGDDLYSSGLSWAAESGVVKSRYVDGWSYLGEMERRLAMLETNMVPRPAIGKHITWWADFTEQLAGDHPSYVDRVHSAVSGITDRAIVLWRRDLRGLAASLEVLSFGFSTSDRSLIRTHGKVVVGDDINKMNMHQANRFVRRFVRGLAYLDRTKTVMIDMSELDQVETITWPDGYQLTLDNRSINQYKNSYYRQDVEQVKVNSALDLVTNQAEINGWAEKTEYQFDWSNLRENNKFSRGF
jgi:hypothetical protein